MAEFPEDILKTPKVIRISRFKLYTKYLLTSPLTPLANVSIKIDIRILNAVHNDLREVKTTAKEPIKRSGLCLWIQVVSISDKSRCTYIIMYICITERTMHPNGILWDQCL